MSESIRRYSNTLNQIVCLCCPYSDRINWYDTIERSINSITTFDIHINLKEKYEEKAAWKENNLSKWVFITFKHIFTKYMANIILNYRIYQT
jgi:hypothetical protein